MKQAGFLIIIVGILLLLAITNPTITDFSVWAAEEYDDHEGWLGAILGELSRSAIEISTKRDNYIFFQHFLC